MSSVVASTLLSVPQIIDSTELPDSLAQCIEAKMQELGSRTGKGDESSLLFDKTMCVLMVAGCYSLDGLSEQEVRRTVIDLMTLTRPKKEVLKLTTYDSCEELS